MGKDMPRVDYLPTKYWPKRPLRPSQATKANASGNTLDGRLLLAILHALGLVHGAAEQGLCWGRLFVVWLLLPEAAIRVTTVTNRPAVLHCQQYLQDLPTGTLMLWLLGYNQVLCE